MTEGRKLTMGSGSWAPVVFEDKKMKLNRAYMKTVAFLSRQMPLAFNVAKTEKLHVKEAKAMIRHAVRLIDRNSKNGAEATKAALLEVLTPFFGKGETMGIIR